MCVHLPETVTGQNFLLRVTLEAEMWFYIYDP